MRAHGVSTHLSPRPVGAEHPVLADLVLRLGVRGPLALDKDRLKRQGGRSINGKRRSLQLDFVLLALDKDRRKEAVQ